RQSAVQTLCVSTMARLAGIRSRPLRNISARLAKNSSAMSRKPRGLANTASPTTSITGPISLAMKTDVDIGHPPHAASASVSSRACPHPSRSDERATLPRKREREEPDDLRSLSRLRGRVGVGVYPQALISRRLRILSEPGAHPRVGIGVLGDVADHGDRIGAGGENLARLFELDAADRNQRERADALLPFGDLGNALRREPHRFQRGRKAG